MSKILLNKKNLFIFFITILLFINAVFIAQYFFNQKEVEIKVSENGFSPSVIKVSQGTRVKFINSSRVTHWPASDLHPTHTEYSEFDPKKGIDSGGVWIFTPLREGKFEFHDHLFPHNKGILYVDEALFLRGISYKAVAFMRGIFFRSSSLTTKVNTENFSSLNQESQLTVLKQIKNDKESLAAWEFVQTKYAVEQGERGKVHDLAHFAGTLLYEEYDFAGLSKCTPAFAFGCYHGFLDSAFRGGLDRLSDAEVACRTVGEAGTGPYGACVHGIGHGVASYFKVEDLGGALEVCDRLGSVASTYCTDGVFMEFERNAAKSFYNAGDPLFPCNKVGDRYVFSCGRNQSSVMIQRLGLTYDQVAIICAQSPRNDLVRSCVDSLGFISANLSGGKSEKVISKCKVFQNDELMGRCVTAAAGELVFQEIENWKTESFAVCDSLDSEERKSCEVHVERIISDYDKE